ncbi:MarR family transcriptional regulator [Actinopolymorpha sp. B17G11]|uniref:MarR family winged helix-turn-helix transcriptional regulator n=1 Tax=Actinopolymorpha sp. B17G11 TaxID=3160861 RepID=UPI0032E4464D
MVSSVPNEAPVQEAIEGTPLEQAAVADTSREPSPTLEDEAELTLAEELLSGIGALRRGLLRCGPDWPFGPLTGAQAELLRLVRREPGISVANAAATLRVAPNTVSTLVRQLSAAELLRRDADASDRRVARLQLTAAAEGRLGAWRDRRSHAVAAALRTLPADQRAVLAAVVPALAALTNHLEATTGPTGPTGATKAATKSAQEAIRGGSQ